MMNCFKYFLAHLNIFSFLIKPKTDRTNIRPSGRGPETYDPRIDYADLVWQLYYESHKGQEEAEKLKSMMDSLGK